MSTTHLGITSICENIAIIQSTVKQDSTNSGLYTYLEVSTNQLFLSFKYQIFGRHCWWTRFNYTKKKKICWNC